MKLQQFLVHLDSRIMDIITYTNPLNSDLENLDSLHNLVKSFTTEMNQVSEYQLTYAKLTQIQKVMKKALEFSSHSRLLATIDCMTMKGDGLWFPATILVMNDSMIFAKFYNKPAIEKEYKKICKKIDFRHTNGTADDNISTGSSNSIPASRSSSCSNLAMKSGVHFRHMKYSKIFSGLSKLKFNSSTEIYSNYFQVAKSAINKIAHVRDAGGATGGLYIKILAMLDDDEPTEVVCHLVPRAVARISDFCRLNWPFPDDFKEAWLDADLGTSSTIPIKPFLDCQAFELVKWLAELYGKPLITNEQCDFLDISAASFISTHHRSFMEDTISITSHDTFKTPKTTKVRKLGEVSSKIRSSVSDITKKIKVRMSTRDVNSRKSSTIRGSDSNLPSMQPLTRVMTLSDPSKATDTFSVGTSKFSRSFLNLKKLSKSKL